jgi:hypothetical protein
MTEFDDVFVDIGDFQPPDKWQARAGNLLVWLIVLILLVAGWFLKDWMMTQFRYLALAESAPAIPYPVQWQIQPAPNLALQVFDPESHSAFAAREEVGVYPLPEGDLAVAWPEMRRQQNKEDYHEVDRLQAVMRDGRQALLLNYTYVAEADANGSTPLVVVKAQDIAFAINDGREDRLVVVTLASDVQEWDAVKGMFGRILQKMGLPVVH